MTKLRDVMMRDPFERAYEQKTAPPLLKEAFLRLGFVVTDVPLMATPANRRKGIIDAKADGRCSLCQQAVWMSPSSWRSKDLWTCIVCLECLEKAVGMEAFDP